MDRRADAVGREPHEADRAGLRVRRLQPRAARRGHVLRGDQRRAGAHAGAGVRRGEVAIRLGDRRRDGGVRSDDGELRDARTRPRAAGSWATRPPPERMRRRSPPVSSSNMSTDGINVRRQNFSFFTINHSNFATVDPSFRGLTINGAADPRVAVTNAGKERNRARRGDLHARQVSGAHHARCRSRATPRRSSSSPKQRRRRVTSRARSRRSTPRARRTPACRRSTAPARPRRRSRRRSSKSVAASCSSRAIASAICGGTTCAFTPAAGTAYSRWRQLRHADLLPAA